MSGHGENNKTFLFHWKKLGEHEILWYLQKFHGKFYVLAALCGKFQGRNLGALTNPSFGGCPVRVGDQSI
jgi:hypothetical protein